MKRLPGTKHSKERTRSIHSTRSFGNAGADGDACARSSVDLQRIVRRCLAKDPEERYQTIKTSRLKRTRVNCKRWSRYDRAACSVMSSGSRATRQYLPALRRPFCRPQLLPLILPAPKSLSIRSQSQESTALTLVIAIAVLAGIVRAVQIHNNRSTSQIVSLEPRNLHLTTTERHGRGHLADGVARDVEDEGGQQSLMAAAGAVANNNTQIVPPAKLTISAWPSRLMATTFTTPSAKECLDRNGYQVTVLGGTARRLLTGIALRGVFAGWKANGLLLFLRR